MHYQKCDFFPFMQTLKATSSIQYCNKLCIIRNEKTLRQNAFHYDKTFFIMTNSFTLSDNQSLLDNEWSIKPFESCKNLISPPKTPEE